jgi:hypothetical protein
LGPEDIDINQLPDRLHQAATNLASCPSWQEAKPTTICLEGQNNDDVMTELTSDQALQLLQALAPLGGVTRVTKFDLHFSHHRFPWGAPEVQALGHSLGDSIQTLVLSNCSLSAGFWSSLLRHIPDLSEIQLRSLVSFKVHDLAIYLSRRPADRPLSISLPMLHHIRLEGLEDSLQLWGVHNVHITANGY